ncbi:MAG TPA: kelch repeat-containing protein [Planctomycetota bacterium]|jgi:hypothetical protein|nr:kelch repeat-containing protein [Planctomycetota bacterium]
MRFLDLRGATAGAAVALASLTSAQTGLWTNVLPSASPPYRATEGLAFEPVSGLVIAYGGVPNQSATPSFNDTWAFDGCTWTQLFPTGNPGTRFNAYLAPSPTPGRVVLFGGGIVPSAVDGATWELDTQTLTWTDMTPAGPSPSPRQLANTVYDSFRGRTVLFGGTNSSGSTFYGDTWEWDGTTWTDVTPSSGPSPTPRAWHSMTYDSARQRTVLFGGYTCSPFPFGCLAAQLNDTWEWDGIQWVQVVTAASPSPRSSGAIAYDPWSQRVVLFAGSAGWPVGMNDTWEYDGTNWSPVAIPGPVPPPQFLHRMVGDPVRGGVLVYGAFGNGWSSLNDTWRYHHAALSGTPLNPAPGAAVSYLLSLPSDAGLPYAAAISLSGTCPGFPLPDGRVVPLNFDAFTSLSISGAFPTIFQGFAGTLTGGGFALLTLSIPPIPALSGTVISAAAVSVNGAAVGSLTNAVTVVVQ